MTTFARPSECFSSLIGLTLIAAASGWNSRAPLETANVNLYCGAVDAGFRRTDALASAAQSAERLFQYSIALILFANSASENRAA